MKISLVLGLGYGDEAKGATVNSVCGDGKNTVVVRFGSGHQVGHTVVQGDLKHVFSNFGSGTLKGVPTYYSEYCTVNPLAVFKEGEVLRAMGITPKVYYDENAMLTTPYDIYQNMHDSTNKSHGTVGVGFGKTIQRNEDHYRLFVRDLEYPTIRDEKLRLIAENYYKFRFSEFPTDNPKTFTNVMNNVIIEYKAACDDFVRRYRIVRNMYYFLNDGIHLVFEGGQGIMLDQDFGFFPHVTRGYCTSRNAMEIIKKYEFNEQWFDTYYVTRAYQTRHGNGFMSNENLDKSYIGINPDETNIDTGAQGVFRRAVLDLDQLKYAISCDEYYNPQSSKNLVITCVDHVGENIPITQKGNQINLKPKEIALLLGINDYYISNSDKGFLHY